VKGRETVKIDHPAGDEALCGVPHSTSYVDPANMRRGRCGAVWRVAVGAGGAA